MHSGIGSLRCPKMRCFGFPPQLFKNRWSDFLGVREELFPFWFAAEPYWEQHCEVVAPVGPVIVQDVAIIKHFHLAICILVIGDFNIADKTTPLRRLEIVGL